MSAAHASSVFPSSFSTNLLGVYHKCRSLIGYATHYIYSVIDSE